MSDPAKSNSHTSPLKILVAKARGRYRKLPIRLRRTVDSALGTGIYKRPMLRRGALFIHVPKSAGTSISQSLFGIAAVGHYTAREALAYDPAIFARLFKFAYVRHPISRAYSAYRYLQTGGTPDTPVAMPHLYRHLQNASFGEFVDWLESIDVDNSNPVVSTQAKYVCDASDVVMVDFVGRFESIDSDFLHVCQQLGMQSNLMQKNISQTQEKPIDPALASRLRRIYDRDFAIFGYV